MREGLPILVAIGAMGIGWAQDPPAVEAIRQYALNYSQSLPDYTCQQDTERVENSRRAGASVANTIQEEISFVGGVEHYKVLKVNGVAAKNVTHEQLNGALSGGEFRGLLKQIFDRNSATAFRQQSSGKLHGREMTALPFRVPQQTGYLVRDSALHKNLRVAFEGSVWADPKTNAVMKIAMHLVDIPKESELEGTEITLEYKAVDLSGQQFILPSQFEWSWLEHSRGGTLGETGTNLIKFTNCRKFTAESNIDFGK
jgi:hypothetical protein